MRNTKSVQVAQFDEVEFDWRFVEENENWFDVRIVFEFDDEVIRQIRKLAVGDFGNDILDQETLKIQLNLIQTLMSM